MIGRRARRVPSCWKFRRSRNIDDDPVPYAAALFLTVTHCNIACVATEEAHRYGGQEGRKPGFPVQEAGKMEGPGPGGRTLHPVCGGVTAMSV